MWGFTLIEVVVALAICAAMLVSILAVRSQLIAQAQRAMQLSSANVLAGDLVASWQLGTLVIPMGERRTGTDDESRLHWQLVGDQEEIPPSGFLQRLSVRIYDQSPDVPLVSLRAWKSLAASGGNGG